MASYYVINDIQALGVRYAPGSLVSDSTDNIQSLLSAGAILYDASFPDIAAAASKAQIEIAKADYATAALIMSEAVAAHNASSTAEAVANEAALSSVSDAALATGVQRWVESVRDFYTLDKAALLTPEVGVNAATLSGTGAWVRSGTPHPSWREQGEWWFDEAAGNDEGDGSHAAPIKTWDEYLRRTGIDWTVNRLVNFWVVGSISRIDWLQNLGPDSDARVFPVLGAPLRSSTTTRSNAQDEENFSLPMISDDQVVDWTPYVNKLLVIDEQTELRMSTVYKDNGNNSDAVIAQPMSYWDGTGDQPADITSARSVGNERDYFVYDRPVIGQLAVKCNVDQTFGPMFRLTFGPFALGMGGFSGAFQINVGFPYVGFLGMDLGFPFFSAGSGYYMLANCVGSFAQVGAGSHPQIRGGIWYGMNVEAGSSVDLILNPLIATFGLFINGYVGLQTDGFGLEGLLVMDVTDEYSIEVRNGGFFECRNWLWGSTANGVNVDVGSAMSYTAARPPKVVCSGIEITIGASDKLFSDLPFTDANTLSTCSQTTNS